MATPVNFTGDAENLRLGPCSVTYGTANLGYTLNDSVSISLAQETAEIRPDQSATPVKDIIISQDLMVRMTLGEITVDRFNMVPGFDAGQLKEAIGIDLLDKGAELILYPMSTADTKMYVFPKATPFISGDISFARNTPQGLELTFKCYKSSGTEGYSMSYEDKSDA